MMTKRFLLGLVLAATATLSGGCQDDPEEDPNQPQSSTAYFQAAREALCERAVGCVQYPDTASCLDAQHRYPDAQTLSDADRGMLRYDPEAGARCLAAIKTVECEYLYGFETPFECEDVYVAAVELGGACRVGSDQCVGGDCSPCDADGNCVQCTNACCTGTCVAEDVFNDRREGEACDQYTRCLGGTFCNADVCSPLPGPGEICMFSTCGRGSQCDYFSDTCYALSGEGEPCQLQDDRQTCSWRSHLACDMTTVTCELLPGPGENCADSCRGDNVRCVTGLCVWLPNVGERCLTDGSSPCLNGLDCNEQGWCEAVTGAEVCL
jgi:hypothetical protein